MINLISTFVAVVDAGSFSEAGRRLNLPKSAISRRIEQLEKRLDARLLQRSTRAVRPTEAGSEYYRRCVHILAEIEDDPINPRIIKTEPSVGYRFETGA